MDQRAKSKAALIILLCLASGLLIFSRFELSTDLAFFLPEPKTKVERLLRHQLDHGASSGLIFIALTGRPPEQLAELSRRMVTQLSAAGVFRKVSNRAGDVAAAQLAMVEQNRYLLSHHDLAERFSVEGLRAALQQRLRGLSSSQAQLEKRYLQRDPSGEVLGLLSNWQGSLSKYKIPQQLHGVWFSEDRQRSLILAELDAETAGLDNQTVAVETIRRLFQNQLDRLASEQASGLKMIMTGPAAFAVESSEDIKADVQFLTYLAIAVVVLFLWMVYRSFFAIAMVVMPLLVGVVVATASILMFNGRIHAITLAFGVTLAGVAVDYPIHILTGLRSTAIDNQQHILRIWPTLRLGVLSTIIAYAAFLVSGFGGLLQLGVFTIIGLTTAAIFSRYVLPYLMTRTAPPQQGLRWFHDWLKGVVGRVVYLRWLVPGGLLVSWVAFATTSMPILHLNVDSLSPIKDSRRAEGKLLRDDLGFWSGGKLFIITAPDQETVLQKSEMLEIRLNQLVAQNQLSGFDMAAQFLPSQKTQQHNLAAIQDIDTINANLQAALVGLPFKPDLFAPFIAELSTAATLQPLTLADLRKTAIGDRLSTLLFDLKEDDAGGVILLHDVADNTVMQQFAAEFDHVIFMELKAEATNLVARSVKWVSLVMIGCVLLVYLILTHAFASWTRALKIILPTFSAAAVAAGGLVFTGQPLSIFHLISLLLVVGLGLDYALFFNRLQDNAHEWDTTFKSLWVCGITTILVFGVLAFSQTPPLRAIGVTVGMGASISLVFASLWATIPQRQK